MAENLIVEVRNQIAIVTLNRPDVRNAFDDALIADLTQAFEEIDQESSIVAMVLTGAGKAFCAGGNAAAVQETIDNPKLFLEGAEKGKKLVHAILDCPKPIIAKVNGAAMGLGATIALFCDITLMADTARIGDPHVRAGLVAGDGGTVLWPMVLGLNRGKEYLFTGDLMNAAEALAFGAVNHVHPRDDLAAQALELARRIASGPTVAIQFNKRLANADLVDRVNRVLDASLAMEALTFESADHREAVAAFLAKRAPKFG